MSRKASNVHWIENKVKKYNRYPSIATHGTLTERFYFAISNRVGTAHDRTLTEQRFWLIVMKSIWYAPYLLSIVIHLLVGIAYRR